MVSVYVVAFGVIFTVISLSILAFGVYSIYRQERALRSYKSTEATVIGTEIDTVHSPGGDVSTTYKPVVEYRYHVDEDTYTAGIVYPGGTPHKSDRGWAESVVSDYQQGETVTAYYNPATPDDAYLVRRRDMTKFALVVVPLGLLVTALVILQ